MGKNKETTYKWYEWYILLTTILPQSIIIFTNQQSRMIFFSILLLAYHRHLFVARIQIHELWRMRANHSNNGIPTHIGACMVDVECG